MPVRDSPSAASPANIVTTLKDIAELPGYGNLAEKSAEFFLDLAVKTMVNLHTVYNCP
jgi:hypothetical protein